jgi:hypothetical protein
MLPNLLSLFPLYVYRLSLFTLFFFALCFNYLFFRRGRKITKKGLLASSCLFVCPSVRPSVCPHGTTRLPLDEFLWNLIGEHLSKLCRESPSFIKIPTYIYDHISLVS